MTFEPPVLVKVSGKVLLLPTCTLPNGRLAGLAPTAPSAVPVPDKGIVSEGFDPFEATVTLPLKLVADVGVKTTLKLVDCPALSVTGAVTPLNAKPVPPPDIEEIVTLELPVLVKVADKVLLLPTCTLPNPRPVGLAEIEPSPIPVPATGMVKVGFDALDAIVTVPEKGPADCGANVTVKLVLFEAPTVSGVVIPLT